MGHAAAEDTHNNNNNVSAGLLTDILKVLREIFVFVGTSRD